MCGESRGGGGSGRKGSDETQREREDVDGKEIVRQGRDMMRGRIQERKEREDTGERGGEARKGPVGKGQGEKGRSRDKAGRGEKVGDKAGRGRWEGTREGPGVGKGQGEKGEEVVTQGRGDREERR